jgi:HPt (histidine-containing phosphotransfer) domain-containing protein
MNFKALAIDCGMEEDEVLELVKLFIETSLSDLNQIQSAIDEGDAQKVAMAAHSIKGAAANLGLTEIFEMAKRIEMNGRENKLDGAEGTAVAIEEKLDELAKSSFRFKEDFASGR